MPTAILSSFHRLPFYVLKDMLKNKVSSYIHNQSLAYNSKPVAEEPFTYVHCKCCSWKGKSSDAKYKVLVEEHAAEIELFCPRCHSYAGFVTQ